MFLVHENRNPLVIAVAPADPEMEAPSDGYVPLGNEGSAAGASRQASRGTPRARSSARWTVEY
jgi:hypothetical protein